MSKFAYAAGGATFGVLVLGVVAKGLDQLLGRFRGLSKHDLKPGPWYLYYLGDYLTAHPDEKAARSAVVELNDGTFVWATETPEWDAEWFEKHGWEFPDRWTPYSALVRTDAERVEYGEVQNAAG